MPNLSVGPAISRAYGFLFRRFFVILGLSWLPATLLGASIWFWMTKVAAEIAQSATLPTDSRQLYLAGSTVLMMLAVAFFAATIAVPVTQDALGVRSEPVGAHFVVGARELRLFFATIRLAVLVLAAVFLFAVTVSLAARLALTQAHIATATASWHGIADATLIAGGTGLLTLLLAAFLWLRLGFLLQAVAATEQNAGLFRAWILSRGQTGRLLLVSLAVIVPVALLSRAIEFGLFGSEVLGATSPHALIAAMVAHAAILSLIVTIALTVQIALVAGATGAAYRALSADEGERESIEHRNQPTAVIAPTPFLEPAFAKAPQQPVSGEAPSTAIDQVESVAAPAAEEPHSLEPAIAALVPEGTAEPEPAAASDDATPVIAPDVDEPATDTAATEAPAEAETAHDETPLPSHDPLPDTVVMPETETVAHVASESDATVQATPNRDADFDIGTSHDDPFSFPLRAPAEAPAAEHHDVAA